MGSKLWKGGAVLLAAAGLQTAAIAGTEDSTTTPSPVKRPKRRLIDQIDEAVAEVLRAHQKPCAQADREGVPCFPVTLTVDGPRYSVAESMRNYRTDGRDKTPSPNRPPTGDEVSKYLSGATKSTVGGVSFDPVCTVKSLVRLVKGGATTFYLYRLRDANGEHPLLTDRDLGPNPVPTRPDITYEFMGKYTDECKAIAAWRHAVRNPTSPEETKGSADPPEKKSPAGEGETPPPPP